MFSLMTNAQETRTEQEKTETRTLRGITDRDFQAQTQDSKELGGPRARVFNKFKVTVNISS